jgi:hypothetical protein
MLSSLRRAEISEGHARALLMLSDRKEEQEVLYREILLKKISVRETERISRKIATDKVRKQEWEKSDPTLIEFERKLTETLGTRVKINKTYFGGTVSIDYFDPEDLQKIIDAVAKKTAAASLDVVATEAVIDTLAEEKAEANEVMAKLAENTPLEVVTSSAEEPLETNETVINNAATVPALDTLVEPPALDTLVTPPTTYEDRFNDTKELLNKIETEKNNQDESDMYSIKNFGV